MPSLLGWKEVLGTMVLLFTSVSRRWEVKNRTCVAACHFILTLSAFQISENCGVEDEPRLTVTLMRCSRRDA
jgi:hypothetical protein